MVFYLGMKGRRIAFTIMSYGCLFFVIPIGFLWPIWDAKGFYSHKTSILVLFIILLSY